MYLHKRPASSLVTSRIFHFPRIGLDLSNQETKATSSHRDAFLCIQHPNESHGSRTAELVHGDLQTEDQSVLPWYIGMASAMTQTHTPMIHPSLA